MRKQESSLLTEAQREYLRGDAEIEPGSAHERAMRSRIRKRLAKGFLDFRLVFDYLSEHDRDALLDKDAHERYRLQDGMIATVALLREVHEVEGWPFGEFLRRSLDEVYTNNKRNPTGMVVNEVVYKEDLTPPKSHDELYRAAQEKYQKGDVASITDQELREVVERGGIPAENIIAAVQEERKKKAREEHEEKMIDRENKNVEIYGSGYTSPPDIHEDEDSEK